jgi:hypothetical protein
METEQHTAKRTLSDWRNKGRNQKAPRIQGKKNITNQNLWDTAKAMLSGKFTPVSATLKKQRTLK